MAESLFQFVASATDVAIAGFDLHGVGRFDPGSSFGDRLFIDTDAAGDSRSGPSPHEHPSSNAADRDTQTRAWNARARMADYSTICVPIPSSV